jgi:pyruvate formate lyase activating enzyme
MKADAKAKINVSAIQRFCMRDGPGVRTTVFLKGCPLRCQWCHNPEAQSASPELLYYAKKCLNCQACLACEQGAHSFSEGRHHIDKSKCVSCFKCAGICPSSALQICGKVMTVEEICSEAEKDLAFYGESGGITLSGGEPLFQPAAVDLLFRCKEKGLNTVLDTCGYFPPELLAPAVAATDLFLWDVKDTDDARHKQFTGVSNKTIFENLRKADELGAKIKLRFILVNGVNSDERHYEKCAELCRSLTGGVKPEVIPYHAFGGVKSEFLMKSGSGRSEWIPTEEQLAQFREYLGI